MDEEKRRSQEQLVPRSTAQEVQCGSQFDSERVVSDSAKEKIHQWMKSPPKRHGLPEDYPKDDL